MNETDPLGLHDCGWTDPEGCVANTATTAWNDTGGKVVHAAATGTFGVCISGSIGWGLGGTASGCVVESHFFELAALLGLWVVEVRVQPQGSALGFSQVTLHLPARSVVPLGTEMAM